MMKSHYPDNNRPQTHLHLSGSSGPSAKPTPNIPTANPDYSSHPTADPEYSRQDNFMCEKCDKMYTRVRDLEIHMSYCTG